MRRLVGFVAGALLPGRNRNLGAQLCRRSVSNALKLVDDVLKGEQHFLAERSFNKEPGAVYVVATPIGNMEDFTLRGLRVLRGNSFFLHSIVESAQSSKGKNNATLPTT
mmetsp:Transcript_4746/g.20369  ORF Transcript_4746/g.20369 Transcript_4746/m.20369 type:complete len:109 (+) Transcript_4746:100-426(+)